jgi:hypothetical protein
VFRKRKTPTPDFRLPPPFNPMQADEHKLLVPGIFPHCAMFQVAAVDTHRKYLICRGYDPRDRHFYDYDSGDPEKPGVLVAKPYLNRVKGSYRIAQLIPAVLPKTKLGWTSGVAETACGNPVDLDEELPILWEDDGPRPVHWLALDGIALRWVRLEEDLYPCGEALARFLANDETGYPCEPEQILTVSDPHATVEACLLALTTGMVPADSHVLVMPAAGEIDNSECLWIPVAYGSGSCCESESPPSISASSSPISPSSPSSSPSPSPSISVSESPPSQSASKSTAIVPASWSPTGYTALFIAECPEVRFDDVMVVRVPQRDARLSLDVRYVEVCAKDTVQVCGCVPDLPVLVGASVDGGEVQLRFAEQRPDLSVRLVIRLTGIRRGFTGYRFPDRSRVQFEANERFIRSAYPDG